MPKTKSALVGLIAALVVIPAAAQQSNALPLRAEAEHLVLNAPGQQMTLPLPDWAELAGAPAEGLLERVSAHVREDEGEVQLEIYPRGEGQALWSRLYGARIFNQPNLPLADLRSVIIDVYGRSCQPETIALFQLEPDDGDNIPPLGYVCGAYRNLPGYNGKGEVMIMGFYKSSAGVAMLYQEWRGAAFNPADSASWPVSPAEIEARVVQFKAEAALTSVD